MSYFIIELTEQHPDAPKYWCGYEANRQGPGGGTHAWWPHKGAAIRFCRLQDALKAGVGAPNTPYFRTDTWPDRGVKITEVPDEQ